MSASDQPPVPGTRPIVGVDFEPTLPRYREDPGIAANTRRAGRTIRTDGARAARVDAVARDLARTDPAQAEARASGTAWEVASSVVVNLAAAARARASRRAAVVQALAVAARRVDELRRRVEDQLEARVRRREEVPPYPPFGVALTQLWVALLPLPVLVFLETKLGTGALAAALPTEDRFGVQMVAGAIATVMTLAFEAAALVAGTLLARAVRRVTIPVGAALAFVLVGLTVWSVVALAGSREVNIAYGDSLRPTPTQPAGGFGGFGTAPAKPPARGFEANSQSRPGSTAGERSGGPRLGFVVPITLLALTIGMVLALRCGVAHPWRDTQRRLQAAESKSEASSLDLGRAEVDLERAAADLEADDLEWAGEVRREAEFGTLLLNRLQAEYDRACAVAGRPAGLLPLPPMPTVEELVEVTLDPPRAPARLRGLTDGSTPSPNAPGSPAPRPETPSHPDEPPAPEEDLWAAPDESSTAVSGPAPTPSGDTPATWGYTGPPLRPEDAAGSVDDHRHTVPPSNGDRP